MAKRKKKKMVRNIVLAVAAVVVVLLVVSAVSTQNSADKVEYEKALQYLIDAEDPSLLGKANDKARNKKYNQAYTILKNQGRTDEIFNSRLKRAMNLADDARYDDAFAFINDNVLNQDETIYTQAMEEAIDDAYAYIEAKILERADEKLAAKHMSKATKEDRLIRADAIKTASEKKRSYKLLKKYGSENLIFPDSSIPEEIKSRTFSNEKERRAAKRELKAYTKGVSVYRRITKPYYDAKNLIIQEENYKKLDEIEALYKKVISNDAQ